MTPDQERKIDELHAMLKALLRQTGPKRPMGDEKIFKDPSAKHWNGDLYAGRQMSEAPPDYLRAFAKYKGACAYMARKENDPTKTQYADRDEKSAKLAEEWVAFKEATEDAPKQAPRASAPQYTSDDDGGELPF